jgi:hypothetical protein
VQTNICKNISLQIKVVVEIFLGTKSFRSNSTETFQEKIFNKIFLHLFHSNPHKNNMNLDTKLSKVLTILHPGGIRTHDFMLRWLKRWPLHLNIRAQHYVNSSSNLFELAKLIHRLHCCPKNVFQCRRQISDHCDLQRRLKASEK